MSTGVYTVALDVPYRTKLSVDSRIVIEQCARRSLKDSADIPALIHPPEGDTSSEPIIGLVTNNLDSDDYSTRLGAAVIFRVGLR